MAGTPENMLICLHETDSKKVKLFFWLAQEGSPYTRIRGGAGGHTGNIIGALRSKKLIAQCIFDGRCAAQIFNERDEKVLVPGRIPKKMTILNNASFYHRETIIKIADNTEVFVIFLTPYSPNYNKVEDFLYSIKILIVRR